MQQLPPLYLAPGRTDDPRPNPYESAGRMKKAFRLMEYFVSIEATQYGVSRLTADEWLMVANVAGVNPPSAATKALVIDALRRIEGGRD